MWLKAVLLLLKVVSGLLDWLERERWKAEGKREANEQAKALHDERVAQALAARADADAIDSMLDPQNRDNRG